MKKVLSKAFSVLLAAAILLFGGFGAFALIPITDSCYEELWTYGRNAGITSQIEWELEMSPLGASSNGSVAEGYTGTVVCGALANGYWFESSAIDSNNLQLSGDCDMVFVWIY